MKNFHIKNMCMFYKNLSFWQVLSFQFFILSFHFISKMLSTTNILVKTSNFAKCILHSKV